MSAPAELCEEVEDLLPRRIFRIQEANATRRFFALDNFRACLDPIAKQLAPHIARSDSDPRIAADAFGFARFGLAVDVEFLRRADRWIAREPDRGAYALAGFAKGFEIQVFAALEGAECRIGGHAFFDAVSGRGGRIGV